MPEKRRFIPAAGHDWWLPFYDPFVKLIGGDRARRSFLELAALRPGQRVLEVGCGTGLLLLDAARALPGLDLVGLDPDPRALARAKRKAERAGVSIRLDAGFGDALPYPDARFDRVLSSFMFHHLQGDEKDGMLREVRRVLKPGGFLCLMDFTGHEPGARRSMMIWLHSHSLLHDSAPSRVVARTRDAGFQDPRRVGVGTMGFGLIGYSCYTATNTSMDSHDAS